MRWIGFGALVLSACSLFACGGSTTNGNTASGGSAGTSSGGAGGAVGGCNCMAGYLCVPVNGRPNCVPAGTGGSAGTVGSGGMPGTGGAGGSGGSPGTECSAALKADAQLSGADVGFGSSTASGNAKVTQVSPDSLQLSASASANMLEFRWRGPDLTGHFAAGEPVSIGSKDGWDYVAGTSSLAVTRRDVGFVAPQEIPPIPMLAGPHLAYGSECTFTEAQGGCGQPGGTVDLLSIDATTGAGVVSADQGKTIQFMGWQIHNDGSVQYPGYSDGSCVVEAGFTSVITALGPSPVNGGP